MNYNQVPSVLVDTATNRRIILTDHARHRIAQMGANLYDVARAALEPDMAYRGSNNRGRVQRCDESPISIVFDHINKVVVTVLWNTDEEYSREKTIEESNK